MEGFPEKSVALEGSHLKQETLDTFKEHYDKIPEDIRDRICIHRGTAGQKESSVSAIGHGLKYNPYFVEFDFSCIDDDFIQGHFPHFIKGSEGNPRLTLFLFAEHASSPIESRRSGRITFPKFDLRLVEGNDSKDVLGKLIRLWEQPEYASIPQFLLNINDTTKNLSTRSEIIIRAQSEFVELARSSAIEKKLMLNVDVTKYTTLTDEEILKHLESLAPSVLSVSPDTTSDLDAVGALAKKAGIPECHFWLFGPPDYEEKPVSVSELRAMSKQVEPYFKAIYFDISPAQIYQEEVV